MDWRSDLSALLGTRLFTIDGTVTTMAPWLTDFSLALKRTILGTLPATMSATVTDAIT
jgi:hypothetical protein